jgi:hypothetical protein
MPRNRRDFASSSSMQRFSNLLNRTMHHSYTSLYSRQLLLPLWDLAGRYLSSRTLRSACMGDSRNIGPLLSCIGHRHCLLSSSLHCVGPFEYPSTKRSLVTSSSCSAGFPVLMIVVSCHTLHRQVARILHMFAYVFKRNRSPLGSEGLNNSKFES